jgi:hypothetical protein
MLDRPSRAVAGEDGWIALRRAEGFVLVNEADGARWCGGAEPCRCWERGAEREERRRATVDHVPAALELRPAPERAHLVAEARQELLRRAQAAGLPGIEADIAADDPPSREYVFWYLSRFPRQRMERRNNAAPNNDIVGHPQGVASGVRERAG